MESLKFGTSGLRGLVTDLQGWPSFAYTLAFLRYIQSKDGPEARRTVWLGRDLRSSSPAIYENCASAAAAAGFEVADADALPTPALALAAFEAGCPAVMVTGSHIPDDRNGLKFYDRTGEITKDDEAGIAAAFAAIEPGARLVPDIAGPRHAEPARDAYRRRYEGFFAPGSLAGLRIGVFQHSSVARDLLMELLDALGASVVALGRSSVFVPVDTEAHRAEDVAQIHAWSRDGSFDAIVSTDGDADRPLIADERGDILRGDVIGLLTARYLGLKTLVTPVTSSSAIENSGIADKVVRTRVGSPFVISGMTAASSQGATAIGGFEANGGFLLGSSIEREGRGLAALPTRDAVLPILSVLVGCRERRDSLSRIVAALDAGHTAGHRLQEVAAERSAGFLNRLSEDGSFRQKFFSPVGTVAGVSAIDGVKVHFVEGGSMHFRASGNAPELRCYVEAASLAEAQRLLEWGLERADREV